MDKIQYKGYHGNIEYSADDDMLIGSVFGIQDSLNYCGRSIEEITQAFHDCIDGYLEMCQTLGRRPDKEYKGSFNIRVTPQLHRSAAIAAEKQGISLNQFVQTAIERQLQTGGNNMIYIADIDIRKTLQLRSPLNLFSDSAYKPTSVAFGGN